MEEIALAILIFTLVAASTVSNALLFIGTGLILWGGVVYLWSTTPNGLHQTDDPRATRGGRKDPG